jgi:hypothetical protein
MANISRATAMPRDNSPNLTGLPAIQASVTHNTVYIKTLKGQVNSYMKRNAVYTEFYFILCFHFIFLVIDVILFVFLFHVVLFFNLILFIFKNSFYIFFKSETIGY